MRKSVSHILEEDHYFSVGYLQKINQVTPCFFQIQLKFTFLLKGFINYMLTNLFISMRGFVLLICDRHPLFSACQAIFINIHHKTRNNIIGFYSIFSSSSSVCELPELKAGLRIYSIRFGVCDKKDASYNTVLYFANKEKYVLK